MNLGTPLTIWTYSDNEKADIRALKTGRPEA